MMHVLMRKGQREGLAVGLATGWDSRTSFLVSSSEEFL